MAKLCGLDGVTVMSGKVSGVQNQVSTHYAKVPYFTHDAKHRLNLVIVANLCPELETL